MPLDPMLRPLVDELANALQIAVLNAEQVERTSTTTSNDASTLTRSLRRATAALEQLRAEGGAR